MIFIHKCIVAIIILCILIILLKSKYIEIFDTNYNMKYDSCVMDVNDRLYLFNDNNSSDILYDTNNDSYVKNNIFCRKYARTSCSHLNNINPLDAPGVDYINCFNNNIKKCITYKE